MGGKRSGSTSCPDSIGQGSQSANPNPFLELNHFTTARTGGPEGPIFHSFTE
jgi:hypothetical protein